MRSCLLVLVAVLLAASEADPLYQELFPLDGPVQAPYDLARFRTYQEPVTAAESSAAAAAAQRRLEAAWAQRPAAPPGDPAAQARQHLLAYAFGLQALEQTLAAAAGWPAAQRVDLARLLVTEMRLDAAAGLVAELVQADPREPSALRAAWLCDLVLRRHASLAERRPDSRLAASAASRELGSAYVLDVNMHLLLGRLEVYQRYFPVSAKPKGGVKQLSLVYARNLPWKVPTSSDEEPIITHLG